MGKRTLNFMAVLYQHKEWKIFTDSLMGILKDWTSKEVKAQEEEEEK